MPAEPLSDIILIHFNILLNNQSSSIVKAVVGKWNFWCLNCFVVFRITITSSFLFFSNSTYLLPAWGSIIYHLSSYKTLNKKEITFHLFWGSSNFSCSLAYEHTGKRILFHQQVNKLNNIYALWNYPPTDWKTAFILNDLWILFTGSSGSSFREFEKVKYVKMMI